MTQHKVLGKIQKSRLARSDCLKAHVDEGIDNDNDSNNKIYKIYLRIKFNLNKNLFNIKRIPKDLLD